MSSLTTLSNVYTKAVSASNQAFANTVFIDNNNSTTLSMTTPMSMISPSCIYYPTQTMAIDGANIDTALGVELDINNNMYVSGTYNSIPPTIYNSNATSAGLSLPSNGQTAAFAVKYSSTGIANWAVAVDGTGNEQGNSIAIDSSGDVLLAGSYDTASPIVYNASNITSTTVGIFPTPLGDKSAFIVKYDNNGTALWNTIVDGAGTDTAKAIAIDNTNNIIIAGSYIPVSAPINTTQSVVSTVAGSGAVSYGDGIGINSGFNVPISITIDSTGNLYVAEYGSHRIRRITTAGVVSTVAGSGTASFGNGTGTNTGFNGPQGIVADSLGNVYVADSGNARIRKIDSSGVVTTFAGSGAVTYFDATGTNAGFNSGPCGITIDLSGNLYVSEWNLGRIRKITSAAVVTTLAGSGITGYTDAIGTNASFKGPHGLTVDSNGNVYVVDQVNNRIRKITSSGVVTTFAGGGSGDGTGTNAGFNSPFGITIDSVGNLYVEEWGANRIRKITPSQVVTTFAGSGTGTWLDGIGTNAGFLGPTSAVVDFMGNLYVADRDNQRIRKITNTIINVADQNTVTTLAGSGTATYLDGIGTNAGFNSFPGIAVDSTGNIYIADSGNNRIRKITSDGVVTTIAGSGTATYLDATGTNAGFSGPWGIAVDSLSNLYISEINNHRIRKITSGGVVTTFAGSGIASYGDGTGISSGFNLPAGLAVDSFGNVYVADISNNRIRKITSAGVVTTLAGKNTATFIDATGTNAGFYTPTGVTVDSTGNIYVADTNNNRIRKITPSQVVTTFAGSGTGTLLDGIGTNAGFNQSRGISVDLAGNLYVADSGNNSIRKITSAGVVTTLAGGSSGITGTFADGIGTNAGFNTLRGISVDLAGNLYVADMSNNRIRKLTGPIITPTIYDANIILTTTNPYKLSTIGEVTTIAGTGTGTFVDGIGTNAGVNQPTGIAVDSAGNVYVADQQNNRIRKITNKGVVTTFAGKGTATWLDATGTNAGFNKPFGVSIDSTGILYVADQYNNRIRKITSDGVVTTLAGSGTATFLDGTGTSAGFNGPSNVAIDTLGNVYVADTQNNRIRKITSAGVVTTFAGSGTATWLDATGTNASLSLPTGVAIDYAGNLYVSDCGGNRRIRKITPSQVVTTYAGSGSPVWLDATGTTAGFNNPYGIAVDYMGNVYVIDLTNQRIRKISPTQVVTTLAGSGAASYGDGVGSNSGFTNATGLGVDSSGNVYIAEQFNSRIRRIETLGVGTSVFAGSGTASYGDGIGINSGFNVPQGITIDSAGNLYVADSSNSRIRKITSAGIVTTIAGGGSGDGIGTNAGFVSPIGIAVDSIGNIYVAEFSGNRIRKITSTGVVSTLAGGGSGDGIGTNAGFSTPDNMTIDSTGNLYITDFSGNRIRKITNTGVVTTIAGSGTATYLDGTGTNAGFNQPVGITIDSIGNLYVAEILNHRIRKITSAGVVTTFAGSGTATFLDGIGTSAGFRNPYGLTIDSVDNIYVGDRGNTRIRKITSAGVVSTLASGIGVYSLTIDTLGNLYAATDGNQIQKLSAPVAVSTFAGSGTATYLDGVGVNTGFNGPNGMNIDSSNNLYVADYYNHRLRKITPTGVVTTLAGGSSGQTGTFADGTGSNAGFNGIMEMAIDSSGNVYVGDTGNNRIRKVTSAGVVTTLAGSGTASYGDGTGTNSGFNNPYGVAVDSFGNVYVADFNNHRIRKITSTGVVTTFAGGGSGDGIGTNAGFYQPIGTTIDLIGNIYVTEYGGKRIRKITSAGVVTTLAGGGSGDGIGTNAGFNNPFGATVDLAGNVYVIDTNTNSIRKITSAGIVSTIAGSGTATYLDGSGTYSGFNSPRGIAIDSVGNLYVGDTLSNRIRKITFPYPQVQGNTIVTSPTITLPNGGIANPAAFAIKYNSSGISQWSAVVDGTSTDNASSVTTDISGNVYIAGMYGSTQPTVYSGYNTGIVSTLAGGSSGRTGTYADATGTNAGFNTPLGVAIDSFGNAYVTDYGNNRIRKITNTGVVTTFAGSSTATWLDATGTNAGFYQPVGVAIDSSGNIYVGDYANNRIRKITSAGVVTTLAGSGSQSYGDGTGTSTSFNRPYGVAVDSTGNVYVADAGNNRIRKITSTGTVTTLAGSGATGSIDATGTNASFYGPAGVAVDSFGNIYVADYNNNRIRKIISSGTVTTFAGSGTATYLDGIGTNAGFNGPYGIAVDSTGNVYVGDFTNNRIRKITSTGVVTTLAGKGTATYLDATGTNAGFFGTRGLTVDFAGNVYVADSGNNNIRKIINSATPLASITGNAAFGLKLDNSGNSQWIVTADGINNEQALGCATDPSGNFYLTGSYGSNMATIYNANNITSSLILPAASNTSAFVIKYDQYGTALWSGTVMCDSNSPVIAYSVASDAYNNVYIAGSYEALTAPIVYGSNNAYNTNINLPYPTGNGGSNTASFVVKYDSNGTPVTSWSMMGSSNSSPYSISVDTYGSNISLVGMFTGPTTLYDGNNAISSLAFPSGINTQSAFVTNYDIIQPPVTLISNLGNGNNGQQKFITNTGNAPITLNVTSSNNASILSTYTINTGSNVLFNWYNGSWYKFM
jgi:hypothetical protein